MARKPKIERFNEKILSRFQIYNSLFLTLPFKTIKQTSLMMPLFTDHCRKQYKVNTNPKDIVSSFKPFFGLSDSIAVIKPYLYLLSDNVSKVS